MGQLARAAASKTPYKCFPVVSAPEVLKWSYTAQTIQVTVIVRMLALYLPQLSQLTHLRLSESRGGEPAHDFVSGVQACKSATWWCLCLQICGTCAALLCSALCSTGLRRVAWAVCLLR